MNWQIKRLNKDVTQERRDYLSHTGYIFDNLEKSAMILHIGSKLQITFIKNQKHLYLESRLWDKINNMMCLVQEESH